LLYVNGSAARYENAFREVTELRGFGDGTATGHPRDAREKKKVRPKKREEKKKEKKKKKGEKEKKKERVKKRQRRGSQEAEPHPSSSFPSFRPGAASAPLTVPMDSYFFVVGQPRQQRRPTLATSAPERRRLPESVVHHAHPRVRERPGRLVARLGA
jgi:hypothetical protein